MSQISSPNGSSYGVTYTWVQGDTINDPVVISKNTGVVDISLYNFWFTVKPNYGVPDSQAIFGPFNWTIGVGLGVSGLTSIVATKAQTLSIAAGAYVFDFIMIDPSGNETTLMTSAPNGSMIILPRVSLTH